MVQLQLNKSLKMFVSLAITLSVLHQSVEAAFSASSSRGVSELSPSAQVVSNLWPGTHMGSFLDQSSRNFNKLHAKILKSVRDGNLIHVEDGEGDDILHDLVASLPLAGARPTPPKQVYYHNGHYKVRKEAGERVWSHIAGKGGFRKPEIFTIHGGNWNTMSNFDKAEGTGLFEPSKIEELQSETRNRIQLSQQVELARSKLEETLERAKFTTIVLKTAPGGLTDILAKYTDKVAIIWTGPIRKLAHSDGWEIKFNYFRAQDESDQLLALGIPIVVVSPYVGNSRMIAIVDKAFKNEYSRFVPLPQDFPGFSNMASIKKHESALVTNYINGLAEGLMENVLSKLQSTRRKLDEDLSLIKQAKPNMSYEEYQKRILDHKNKVTSFTGLGSRWEKLRELSTNRQKFREYCPVDLVAAPITDPSLKSSVKEVMEVQMWRSDRDKSAINVMPMIGSGIFIVSQLDSVKLEERIQHVIDWGDAGEPKI